MLVCELLTYHHDEYLYAQYGILFFLSHSYGEHRSMLAVPKVTEEPGVVPTTVIPKFAGEITWFGSNFWLLYIN